MSTTAKMAKYRKQLAAYDAHKTELAKPEGQRDKTKLLRPRDIIRMRRRCMVTGRPRAYLNKFGVCRIIFRDMASSGIIPGVRKASW